MLTQSRLRKVNIDIEGEHSLRGCLPANDSIRKAQSMSEFLDTVAVTAATWTVGPITGAAKSIAGFGRSFPAGIKWSIFAHKHFGPHMGQMVTVALAKFHHLMRWGDDLKPWQQLFLATYATSTVETYIGANAGPIGKAATLNIGISEPIAERISTLAELFGWNLGGEIVMEKIWCGG